MAKIILDAGHGGVEPGAMYEGRQEKDDTLRLALAVGRILADNGVEVAYTRTEDVYNTPLEKARIANEEGGDFFVSLHRNSSPEANQYSGVETLVYNLSGEKVALAEAINEELAEVGFRDLGVKARPNLIVLKRTQMPAVLVEAGFLNTEADNLLFDEQFTEVAQAIANGILRTLDMFGEYGYDETGDENSYMEMDTTMDGAGTGMEMGGMAGGMMGTENDAERDGMQAGEGAADNEQKLYRVQTGAFRNRAYAEDLLYRLLRQNYPAFILMEDGYYKVQVGAYAQLRNAVNMEKTLRRQGYSTFITT